MTQQEVGLGLRRWGWDPGREEHKAGILQVDEASEEHPPPPPPPPPTTSLHRFCEALWGVGIPEAAVGNNKSRWGCPCWEAKPHLPRQ